VSKDVLIAGGIVAVCLVIIAVLLTAPKSKPDTLETETTITELPGPSIDSALPPLPAPGLPPLPPAGPVAGPGGGLPPLPTVDSNATSTPLPPMGNLPPVSSLPQPAPVVVPAPAPVAEAKVHVVKSGEYLSDIAQQYLGSAKRWPELIKANPGLNPSALKVGQKVNIPAAASPASDAGVAVTPVAPGERTYTIAKGDTLYGIAEKELGHGSKWKEISTLNNGLSAGDLKVGKVIKLPAKADSLGVPKSEVPAAGGRTHTVTKGQSGMDISRAVYGNANHWKEIEAANPGVSATNLKVGQKLVIPELAAKVGSGSSAPSTASPVVTAGANEYVVKSGDTLRTIAASQLGSPNQWEKLQAANPGLDSRNLRIGQKIKIPGKAASPEPSVAPAPAPSFPNSAQPPAFPIAPSAPAPFAAPSAMGAPTTSSTPDFASPYGAAPMSQPADPFAAPAPAAGAPAPTAPGAPEPFPAPVNTLR
jgi:nucleoid-associated protein YgaU